MSAQPTQIIKPGAALAAAARPLSQPHRAEGKYPFQWLYEGPNAKFALPNGIIPLPAINAPATQATAVVMSFIVPEGYRFVVSDILMATNSTTYSPGLGLLNFSMVVVYSTGPRVVEYLGNLDFCLGEFETGPGIMKTKLQHLRQRLEFAPLDQIEIQVVNNPGNTPGGGIPAPAATDVVIGILGGFTYPNGEAA